MDEYEARKYQKAIRRGIKIGEANGIKIGEANGIKQTAFRMMNSGSFSDSQISDATGLTIAQIKQLRQQM